MSTQIQILIDAEPSDTATVAAAIAAVAAEYPSVREDLLSRLEDPEEEMYMRTSVSIDPPTATHVRLATVTRSDIVENSRVSTGVDPT